MNKKGYALVTVLFVSTIILMLGMAIANMSTSEYIMGYHVRDYTQAYYLAEAGIQEMLSILKENPEYRPGTNWRKLGKGDYKITFSAKEGNGSIVITSLGRVNKAEVSMSVTANLFIEIDEEKYPEPPHENIEIYVSSWECKGPI